MVSPPPTLLIVDEHAAMRAGLRALLTGVWAIVGMAADGAEALYRAGQLRPQVVLLASRLPTVESQTVAQAIKACRPETRTVLLALYPHECMATPSAGVDVCLLKGCSRQELLAAIGLGLTE